MQWHAHIDMSDAPEDDSMPIGDHQSPGMTQLERDVPHAADAGPSRPVGQRQSGISAGGPLADGPRAMTAPIPGVVAAVMASAGQTIERGDDLLTLDAMKMLNVIRSPWDGTIATVHVEPGDRVVQGEPLVTFVPT